MCDPYNDIACDITMTTVGNPTATFVASHVGDDFQFRGLAVGIGITVNTTPTTLNLDAISPLSAPPPDGAIGQTTLIDYSTIAPALQPTELPISTSVFSYNTGTIAGSTITILAPTYYEVCFNPTHQAANFVGDDPTITYRLRNSTGTIYAEFNAKQIGNDEVTTGFCHVMFLPIDTYRFSIQVTGPIDYNQFRLLSSYISVKRVA